MSDENPSSAPAEPAVTDEQLRREIARIHEIEAVPKILQVVCEITGMGFAAVARVTPERWVAGEVLDKIGFGLKRGGELQVASTICHEIRQSRQAVIIDHVSESPEWRNHPTPAQYGFQSYISMPIIVAGDRFFGTLCAIDPKPAQLHNTKTIETFKLFSELIAHHLNSLENLQATQLLLKDELSVSELRDQFIAVLGHDLRNPLGAIANAALLLDAPTLTPREKQLVAIVRRSASRMAGLIDNLLDFARGRLSGGIPVEISDEERLEPVLNHVISELHTTAPERKVETSFSLAEPVHCDSRRIAQMFSNLLGNAFTYGAHEKPIRISASSKNGEFELWIANAGKPIPEAALAKIFLPFEREQASPSQQGLGLGLGLYIAAEIAKAHGGDLSVSSNDNETRFTFRMKNKAT